MRGYRRGVTDSMLDIQEPLCTADKVLHKFVWALYMGAGHVPKVSYGSFDAIRECKQHIDLVRGLLLAVFTDSTILQMSGAFLTSRCCTWVAHVPLADLTVNSVTVSNGLLHVDGNGFLHEGRKHCLG